VEHFAAAFARSRFGKSLPARLFWAIPDPSRDGLDPIDLRHLPLQRPLRVPEIAVGLEMKPRGRRAAKRSGKANGHFRADGRLAIEYPGKRDSRVAQASARFTAAAWMASKIAYSRTKPSRLPHVEANDTGGAEFSRSPC
jgi:hypothetical protein